MMYPKVSILIISYNQIDFIEEAIQGALSQDYPNLEIIISDDASTDGTAEVIERYRDLHPGLIKTSINKINLGITGNSNCGLDLCTGDFIAFSYGDDILLPNKIALQIEWFLKDGQRVLCGHCVEVFGENKVIGLSPKRLRHGSGAFRMIVDGNLFSATSIMVRASAIPKHGFEPSIKYVTDYIMWIEVLQNGGSYGFIDGVFARYRSHSNNITKKQHLVLEDVRKTLELLPVRYPHLKNACQKAFVTQVINPSIKNEFYKRNFKQAIILVLECLKRGPVNLLYVPKYVFYFIRGI